MDNRRQKSEQMMKQNEEWTWEEARKLQNQLDELTAELQQHLREERRLRQELEEQNKARAQFIAILAHELRTPLTPILGSAQLLIEQFCPESGSPQDRLIRSIVRGAKSLESRLVDLLDLARFQTGAFSLEIAPVDVGGLLNDLASQFQPLAENKGQTFTLDLPQRLPPIKADWRRIGQVVMNLLENAVKFTPDGGRILIRAMPRDQNLVVEVQNSGAGLSSEEQQRLFQPYYRSEVDRQRVPGSGLGLALCKQLVEAHRGKIWVESELGKGSTFGFSVPLKGPTIKVEG